MIPLIILGLIILMASLAVVASGTSPRRRDAEYSGDGGGYDGSFSGHSAGADFCDSGSNGGGGDCGGGGD